jgi:lysophospholipase L1-like esterase
VRKFIGSLVLILFSFGLALVCVEVYARVFMDSGMEYDLEMWKYAKRAKIVSQNPDIGHEHRPNVTTHLMGADFRTNSFGMRDREFAIPKPAGVTRIVFVGDSLTVGWGVDDDKTMPKVLEKLLNARGDGRKYEVVNAGVGNYNSIMEATWMMTKGIKLQPDMVILGYFINDAEPTPHRTGGGLAEWSYAYVVFQGKVGEVWRRLFGGPEWGEYYTNLYRDDAAAWKKNQATLIKLAEFCRERNLPLLMVNFPELRQLDPYPFANISAKIAKLAHDMQVPYRDLLDTVRKEKPDTLWVTVQDSHPDAKADALFARGIYQFVEAEMLSRGAADNSGGAAATAR